MNPNGLSLPIKQPAPSGGPSASLTRQPTPEAGEGGPAGGGGGGDGNKVTTNVEELNDALGAAGLDIGAEEERLRDNDRLAPVAGGVDRSRTQDFISNDAMADVVRRIAASFEIKKLEADTIPLLALAARQRLMAILNDAIAARDHRITATHHRPPPFTSLKRRRRGADGDEDESSDEEDELPEEFGGKGAGSSAKGKNKEPVPAWDQVVFDEQDKVLGALERADREEERRARRARSQRDAKEEEERLLAEQIAREEEENAEGGAGGSAENAASRLLAGQNAAENGDESSTPAPAKGKVAKLRGKAAAGTPASGGDETPKPKKKRVQGAAAKGGGVKNLSEDVKKRLTDQVAMRSLGGSKFSWLNAGGAPPSGAGAAGASKLPPPKFAPASSLPAPTFGAGSPGPSGSALPPPSFAPAVSSSLGPSRLNMTPALHEANRKKAEEEAWNKGKWVIELGDLLFAMERERGMGSGRGSGVVAATKARGGVIANRMV